MMGFKCPGCKKDFGSNKEDLDKHFTQESGECGAYALISLFQIGILTGKNKSKLNRKQQSKRTYSFIDKKHSFKKINIVSNNDGSDNVKCSFCGLKAKRYMSRLKFDGRVSHKRIEKCIV